MKADDKYEREEFDWAAWWPRVWGYWGATLLNLIAAAIAASQERAAGAIAVYGFLLAILLGSACIAIGHMLSLQIKLLDQIAERNTPQPSKPAPAPTPPPAPPPAPPAPPEVVAPPALEAMFDKMKTPTRRKPTT